jgi:uncharacterized protein DUF1579
MSSPRNLQRAALGYAAIIASAFFVTASGQAADEKRPAPAKAASTMPSLYERVDSKLAKDPQLAARVGNPAPELQQLNWLLGTWDVQSTVFATAAAPESNLGGTTVVTRVLGDTWLQFADEIFGKEQDLGFITYNVVTRKWIAAQVDASGNSVTTTSPGWSGNKIVFTGRALIVGEEAMLRQTLEKISDTQYMILNEERLPNGKWVPLDRYVYRKQTDTRPPAAK